jgi:hypothetical protein
MTNLVILGAGGFAREVEAYFCSKLLLFDLIFAESDSLWSSRKVYR